MSYHLRRTDREIKEFIEIEKIIKENKYAILGLCKGNEPYVVTLSYGYDESNQYLYFHGYHKGQKFDFLKSNPRVCLTILDDKGFTENECGHSFRSVVIKGVAEFVDHEEERISAIKILLNHFERDIERMMKKVNPKSETWLHTAIFRIKTTDATGKERNVIKHT
jgi:uncharacterized protein